MHSGGFPGIYMGAEIWFCHTVVDISSSTSHGRSEVFIWRETYQIGMREIFILVLQVLAVVAKPSHKRYFIAAHQKKVHRVVKRAANLNAGFSLIAFRENQLNLHNHYRSLHGVPVMTMDNTLNTEAQSYAEYLAAGDLFEHCRSTTCNAAGAGENLAYAGGHTEVETNATLRWYEEVFDYNYCSHPQGSATTRPGHEGQMVGHFTQVVWTTSTQLGIGYARSTDRTKVYVVARYSPPGNYIGQYTTNVPIANYLLETFQNNCNGVNGGLTEWSAAGPCSRTCGKGIMFQQRTCTNPKPSFNGRDCVGDTKGVVPYWCNSQACASPVDEEMERNEQCRVRGWEPNSYNFGGTSECTLYCRLNGNFFMNRGTVDDGTFCKDKTGACIAGTCTILQDAPATTAPPVTMAATTLAAGQTTPGISPPATLVITAAPATQPPTAAPTTVLAVDGGFTAWSAPSVCSKTCGGGVKYQTRTCTNPAPSGGGKVCEGPTRKPTATWCNPQPCEPTFQERDEQCQARGYSADGHNFGGAGECSLDCLDPGTGYYFGRGDVDDGTKCNKSTSVCVASQCIAMKYASGTVIQGEYRLTPTTSYWKNIVVAIPTGATEVVITNNNPSVTAVIGYRSPYSYGHSGNNVVQGVGVTYDGTSTITINGPVHPIDDFQIVVFAIGTTKANIEYEYTP